MQVCKLFLRILNKNKILIGIYFVIFIAVSFIFSFTTSSPTSIEKYNVAIEYEQETTDTQDLSDYLANYINDIELGDRNIDDAIFYEDIIMHIFVPKDFKERILNDEQNVIIYKSSPNNQYAYSIVSRITDLFNIAKEGKSLGLTDTNCSIQYAKSIISTQTDSVFIEGMNGAEDTSVYIYNILTYVLSSLILMIIGLVSHELSNKEITRRLNITPVSIQKRNLMLVICYFLFSILLAFALSFVPVIRSSSFTNFGYYLMNNIVLSFSLIVLALLISSLVKSNIGFQAVAVAFPLFSAFLSGSMIPQEFISDTTLGIAHILPQYYTIHANHYIANNTFNFGQYLNEIYPILIISGILLGITFLVQKINSRKEL